MLTLSPHRPQGKSYLYFTQFKAELRGAEIEYAMAYVSASLGDPRVGGICRAPDTIHCKELSHPDPPGPPPKLGTSAGGP